MALFTEGSRSKFESTAYTVLLLAFFFAVGLAGGVLYRLLPGSNGTQVASQDKGVSAPAPVQATQSAAIKTSAAVSETPTPPPPAAKPAAAVKPATAPPKPAAAVASVSPAAASTTSSLPAIASPAALPAPPPAADIVSAASEPTPVAAAIIPASGQVSASLPAPVPSSGTTADTNATPPGAAAKPAVAAAPPKPKAASEKRAAVAIPPRPPAPAAPSATGAGRVRIQFGAFAIEDNAHQIQSAVEATGLGTELTQVTTPKGHVIYFVRSHLFPDRAAAVTAATAAQAKAKSLADPVAIDFFIIGDTPAPGQQAQASSN